MTNVVVEKRAKEVGYKMAIRPADLERKVLNERRST